MSFELEPGEKCELKRPFIIDGRFAFDRGAHVVIEAIDPDTDRPGFKYVVFSARLGERVRLRGADLQRTNCKKCSGELDPANYKCPSCGWVAPEKETEALRNLKDKWRKPPSV